jgi:hypothetical protein
VYHDRYLAVKYIRRRKPQPFSGRSRTTRRIEIATSAGSPSNTTLWSRSRNIQREKQNIYQILSITRVIFKIPSITRVIGVSTIPRCPGPCRGVPPYLRWHQSCKMQAQYQTQTHSLVRSLLLQLSCLATHVPISGVALVSDWHSVCVLQPTYQTSTFRPARTLQRARVFLFFLSRHRPSGRLSFLSAAETVFLASLAFFFFLLPLVTETVSDGRPRFPDPRP